MPSPRKSVPAHKVLENCATLRGADGSCYLEITDLPIAVSKLSEEYAASADCGAIATFLGVTRNNFEGRKVTGLEYESYSEMALKQMEKISNQIFTRYDGVHRIIMSHRIGFVSVTEPSVFISITTEHRSSGLEAVAYAINTLKERVPIWKKEYYSDVDDSMAAWKRNPEALSPVKSPVEAFPR
jgi:molybdopterin synthase catalytic subunit